MNAYIILSSITPGVLVPSNISLCFTTHCLSFPPSSINIELSIVIYMPKERCGVRSMLFCGIRRVPVMQSLKTSSLQYLIDLKPCCSSPECGRPASISLNASVSMILTASALLFSMSCFALSASIIHPPP